MLVDADDVQHVVLAVDSHRLALCYQEDVDGVDRVRLDLSMNILHRTIALKLFFRAS